MEGWLLSKGDHDDLIDNIRPLSFKERSCQVVSVALACEVKGDGIMSSPYGKFHGIQSTLAVYLGNESRQLVSSLHFGVFSWN